MQSYHFIHILPSGYQQTYLNFYKLCVSFFTIIQNISSHTNSKRDTANEIDPYAAYYEYYANQQTALEELPNAIAANDINEKQGLADFFGSDTGVRNIILV